MQTKQYTINEFAAFIEEDYLTTSTLVKFMVKLGVAKDTGQKKSAGKGKPSAIYEIPYCVEIKFWDVGNPETNNEGFPGEVVETEAVPA